MDMIGKKNLKKGGKMEKEKKEGIFDIQQSENGKEIAPILSGDKLIEIADKAEKRLEAIRKIKLSALKITNNNDWIDEGGKPYLQVSGAEKIARLFGISWRISEPEIEYFEDGHYTVRFKGEFLMGDVSIEAIGMRSSKDPFFSKKYGKDIPIELIDKADVIKSAYTNCVGNGITRLLGIRNITWDELKEIGISPSAKVEFKVNPFKKGGQNGSSYKKQVGLDKENTQKTFDTTNTETSK